MSKKRPNIAAMMLVLSGTWGDAVVSGVDTNGVPYQTFRKDLIRTGRWFDPKTNTEFEVTDADLDHWESVALAMATNGVKIPVPANHTDDAEHNKGWASNIKRQGDALYADITLYGEEAIKLTSTNEVSVCIPSEMTDGKGNKYTRPIQHIALTPVPVITGQGGWHRIAASRAGGKEVMAQVFRLDRSNGMDIKALAAKFGINTDGMDEAAIWAACAAKADEITASKKSATEATAALSRANSEITTLKASRTDAPKLELDPDALDMMADATGKNLDALVLGGRMGKEERKLWGELLVGTPEARPALALSRKAATAAGLPAPLAQSVLAILDKREPVRQIPGNVSLSNRATPDGDKTAPTPEQVEANVKRMLSLAPAR